jgi:hypothetical protein
MKKLYLSILICFGINYSISAQTAQQDYCDFEGNNVINFGIYTGSIDSMFANPAPNPVDSSSYCAMYIRDTTIYDFIKMYTTTKLEDITLYADSSTQAPKMTMKLYSTAPVGTLIQLQLGIKSVDNYPTGLHSEYTAVTAMQNAWELVTFRFSQSFPGGFATTTNIDKIILLFAPGTTTQDTMYFDDLMGQALMTPVEVKEIGSLSNPKLFQNAPNPAKQSTSISFQLNSKGIVSLELFDMLGNSIEALLNDELKAGTHTVPVDTSELPNGIYFYVLKKDGMSLTKRMIIAK